MGMLGELLAGGLAASGDLAQQRIERGAEAQQRRIDQQHQFELQKSLSMFQHGLGQQDMRLQSELGREDARFKTNEAVRLGEASIPASLALTKGKAAIGAQYGGGVEDPAEVRTLKYYGSDLGMGKDELRNIAMGVNPQKSIESIAAKIMTADPYAEPSDVAQTAAQLYQEIQRSVSSQQQGRQEQRQAVKERTVDGVKYVHDGQGWMRAQ